MRDIKAQRRKEELVTKTIARRGPNSAAAAAATSALRRVSREGGIARARQTWAGTDNREGGTLATSAARQGARFASKNVSCVDLCLRLEKEVSAAAPKLVSQVQRVCREVEVSAN
jgi:hypothetical protein